MGVLKVYDGTQWKNVGCGGILGDVGRLKLWDGTQWVREKCDSEPAATFTDNFTRADSAVAPGPGWTAFRGSTWGINSGALFKSATQGSSGANICVVARPSVADGTVSLTQTAAVLSGGTRVFQGLALRVRDTGFASSIPGEDCTFIVVAWDGIYEVSAGPTFTRIAGSPVFPTVTVPIVVTAVLAGSSITVWLGAAGTGTLLGSVTTTFNQAESWHGVYDQQSAPSSNRFDDFTCPDPPPTARPLYVWTGTAWDRVACMVPA